MVIQPLLTHLIKPNFYQFTTFIVCIPLFLITSDTTVESKSEGTNCSNPGDISKCTCMYMMVTTRSRKSQNHCFVR